MAHTPDSVPEHWQWFTHGRFGMFIHWGLYALPARHEWVKSAERIPDEQYDTYFRHFDPDLYDPQAWARAAKNAGMTYFVITTKHHEGFCLWDSAYTDYKVTNTPYGKDLIRPMVEAFRAEGLHVGFYHSLIDWHHPDFPVDRFHPMRDDAEFRKAAEGRDVRRYAEYLHNQVRELLTQYGKIDYIFYDFSYPGPDGKGRDDWQSESLLRLTRELQPEIIVNDRLDMMDVPGGWDFLTPEQFMARECPTRNGKKVLWETCQTFSGSWGYHRDEATWKSVEQLVLLLVDTVGKGGNLLLNVGPTARGEFDDRAMDRLVGIGEWMKRHSRAIYGCTEAPEGFATPQDCRLTYNPETNRLYVHVLAWPIRDLHLEGYAGKVEYAQLLNDGSEVPMVERGGHEHDVPGLLTLRLPILHPRVTVPVVELFLK
ncbi:MAG: alpha-L-fucosidase [Fimbriimonadia bacterium]|jgi:alpha-L-fucosidase